MTFVLVLTPRPNPRLAGHPYRKPPWRPLVAGQRIAFPKRDGAALALRQHEASPLAAHFMGWIETCAE